MSQRIANKVCIVTGAGSGIGRASAILFAREGAKVVVADIDAPGAEETAATIRENGGETSVIIVDVTDPEAARRLANESASTYGRIDVLFNNAGIAGVGALEEISLEMWNRVMNVNVLGVFLVSKFVVPYMIEQKAGSIINMSSCIAEFGLSRRVVYAASKGAVLSMTKSMQVDYAKYNIRVNALMPGTIYTPFVERYLQQSYSDPEEGRASIRSRQLNDELGTPEDVAFAALYLASDESKFMMASGFVIDGGITGGK